MTRNRRGQAAGPSEDVPDPIEPTRFLIARAREVEQSRRKKFGIKLRFQIQHIMWLSLWTAVVLAVRNPLIASLPEIARVIAMTSGVLLPAMFLAVFGLALLMEEGTRKDRAVLVLFYCMAGDSFLFLCLCVLVFAGRS
jgi:hypothetical protein